METFLKFLKCVLLGLLGLGMWLAYIAGNYSEMVWIFVAGVWFYNWSSIADDYNESLDYWREKIDEIKRLQRFQEAADNLVTTVMIRRLSDMKKELEQVKIGRKEAVAERERRIQSLQSQVETLKAQAEAPRQVKINKVKKTND